MMRCPRCAARWRSSVTLSCAGAGFKNHEHRQMHTSWLSLLLSFQKNEIMKLRRVNMLERIDIYMCL